MSILLGSGGAMIRAGLPAVASASCSGVIGSPIWASTAASGIAPVATERLTEGAGLHGLAHGLRAARGQLGNVGHRDMDAHAGRLTAYQLRQRTEFSDRLPPWARTAQHRSASCATGRAQGDCRPHDRRRGRRPAFRWRKLCSCPACGQFSSVDLRMLDWHEDTAISTLIRSVSCECSPNAPFAKPEMLTAKRP